MAQTTAIAVRNKALFVLQPSLSSVGYDVDVGAADHRPITCAADRQPIRDTWTATWMAWLPPPTQTPLIGLTSA